MFGVDSLPYYIARIPALMIGFAFHEFAHAWVADRLGDPTPRSQGRLTLNPITHLDLFGTLMALFVGFGWAKPVMTNPQYFRGDKKRGHMLVALAGPIMNFLMAFVVMFVGVLTLYWTKSPELYNVIWLIINSIVVMNLGLGIFNLLPIPPLDGFTVLEGILPDRFAPQLRMLEQYGMIILLIFLITNILSIVLIPVRDGIYGVYQIIISLILTPFLS